MQSFFSGATLLLHIYWLISDNWEYHVIVKQKLGKHLHVKICIQVGDELKMDSFTINRKLLLVTHPMYLDDTVDENGNDCCITWQTI